MLSFSCWIKSIKFSSYLCKIKIICLLVASINACIAYSSLNIKPHEFVETSLILKFWSLSNL